MILNRERKEKLDFNIKLSVIVHMKRIKNKSFMQIIYLTKILSKIHKELSKFISKKNPTTERIKPINRHLKKEDMQMENKHTEVV
jgi:hypothetical protein